LPRRRRGAPRVDDRRVISGIMHMLHSGSQWRDCPAALWPVHNDLQPLQPVEPARHLDRHFLRPDRLDRDGGNRGGRFDAHQEPSAAPASDPRRLPSPGQVPDEKVALDALDLENAQRREHHAKDRQSAGLREARRRQRGLPRACARLIRRFNCVPQPGLNDDGTSNHRLTLRKSPWHNREAKTLDVENLVEQRPDTAIRSRRTPCSGS
jgi:hypothetical protein